MIVFNHCNIMVEKTIRKAVGKKRKKIVAFNLSVDNINKLENKIGYNSRSKIVDNLISNFVNKKGPHRCRDPRIPSNGQSNGDYNFV